MASHFAKLLFSTLPFHCIKVRIIIRHPLKVIHRHFKSKQAVVGMFPLPFDTFKQLFQIIVGDGFSVRHPSGYFVFEVLNIDLIGSLLWPFCTPQTFVPRSDVAEFVPTYDPI